MNRSVHLVSGCCGFIGFNFTLFLLKKKQVVYGFDNFQFPTQNRVKLLKKFKNFHFTKLDLSKKIRIPNFTYKNNFRYNFWHLAANSDIRLSSKFPKIDYKNTYLTTKNFLNLSKELKSSFFFFASSSAVYGDKNQSLKEDYKNLNPISNYGKMKLKSEKIIKSDHSMMNKVIFRFPNVVGKFLTHGVIFDFKKRIKNSNQLFVLGNGTQSKPYIRVDKLIKLIYISKIKSTNSTTNIFNIGPHNDGTSVKFIVNKFIKKYNREIHVSYEKKNIGWKGDINKVRFNSKKMERIFKTKKINSNQEIINYFKYDFNKDSI
jgi:UDP-glucose 4-epimerase